MIGFGRVTTIGFCARSHWFHDRKIKWLLFLYWTSEALANYLQLMQVAFSKLDLPHDEQFLIEWLSSEVWPFHGNSRLSVEKVEKMIEDGIFDGTNHETFWILNLDKSRIGLIRLFDLDDIDDGNPLFDIRLTQTYRGKGIGYQAVNWLTKYLFETWPKLKRIEGNTRSDNVAMRCVFRKCYYAKEGHHRQAWPTGVDQYLDAVHYAILRNDWEQKTVTAVTWDDEPSR